MWEVEYTDEFEAWFQSLDENEQSAIARSVEGLQRAGPALGRPHADTIKTSRYSNMKELRTQYAGKPYRTFFAFDPRRSAILLIGGCKAGDKDFYKRMIPLADHLYELYLSEIRKEGLI